MINPNDIRIDYSYSYRTYAGVLEGRPTPKDRIAKAKEQAEELWGIRPTYLMEPGSKGDRVATWTHMIWASGPALDEENDGSALVVIWFSEFEPDTSRVLQALDWTKYAKDFQY